MPLPCSHVFFWNCIYWAPISRPIQIRVTCALAVAVICSVDESAYDNGGHCVPASACVPGSVALANTQNAEYEKMFEEEVYANVSSRQEQTPGCDNNPVTGK